MNELQTRIKSNLRIDVRNHLLYGKVLPNRGTQYIDLTIQLLKEERINIQAEFESSVYLECYNKSNSELSFEEWMDISKSLYSINGFLVTSIARGPDHLKEWHLKSLKEVHNKIVKLINIKRYDHFVKGYTFAYIPKQA